MKTLTLKLPEILEIELNTLARKRGMSRSEVVRQALTEYISRDDISQSGTILDLTQDLAGRVEGPSDLSSNKSYLEKYGQ